MNHDNFNDYFNTLVNASGKKLDWAVKQIKTGKNRELYAKFGTPSKSTFNNWRSHSKPTQSLWMFLVACHVWGFSEKETNHLLKLANLPDLDQLSTDANEHEKELIEAWIQPLTNTRLEGMLQEIKELVKKEEVEKSSYGLIPVTKVAAKTGFDTIPPVQPLPHGSFVPFSPNPHFVGRKEALQQLGQIFFESQPATIYESTIAITGIGGIGKTQLAVEFAHRYGAYFSGGVFWVNCAERDGIPAEIANCGKHMGLSPEFSSMGLQQRQALVQKAWQAPHPCLLIFDNLDVDAEAILNEFRPKTGGARILITSRQQRWSPALSLKMLPLSTLTADQGSQLLRSLAQRLNEKEAAQVAHFLGYFPLALHVAGSFLSLYSHWSSSKYLELLKQKTINSLERRLDKLGASPTAHELSVGRTFMASWEKLDETDELDTLAQIIFSHLVWCAPGEPIPLTFLEKTLAAERNFSETIRTMDQLDFQDYFQDIIDRLINLGLLERGQANTIIVHQLINAFGHQLPTTLSYLPSFKDGLLKEARRCNATRIADEFRTWLPHLLYLAENNDQITAKSKGALYHELGTYYLIEGSLNKAIQIFEKAIELRQQAVGKIHADTATSLIFKGLASQFSGNKEVAMNLYREGLSIRQNVLGPKHPETASAMNRLGTLFADLGEYEKAINLLDEGLKILQSHFGEDSFETVTVMGNLGKVYEQMGEFSLALPLLEKSLAIHRKANPNDHPETGTLFEFLARLHRKMGNFEQAIPLAKESLTIRQASLAKNHPFIAISSIFLGSIYREIGEYKKSLPLLLEGIKIYKKAFGVNDPRTAFSISELGLLYFKMEEFEHAAQALEECAPIQIKVLGKDHPDTIRTLQTLDALKN